MQKFLKRDVKITFRPEGRNYPCRRKKLHLPREEITHQRRRNYTFPREEITHQRGKNYLTYYKTNYYKTKYYKTKYYKTNYYKTNQL